MIEITRTLLAVVAFVGCGGAVGDDTSITATNGESSVSPSSSVVPNGGFEKWRDGKPVGWTLNRGTVFVEDRLRMQGRRSLRLEVDRKDKDKWPYSEMTSAPFSLEPNTEYRLIAWIALKGEKHDVKFEVTGSDGFVVGTYNSFWVRDHPWLQISTSFRTRQCKEYRICLGAASGPTVYTSTYGEPMWIDDIKIEKVGDSTMDASPVDRARGFSLFNRSVMESLDIDSKLPSAAEMVDVLRIRLARGEYEPALLGLYALKDMQGVDVEVAGDLVGPSGARIARKDIVVRRLEAEMLPPTRPRNAKADEILAWWATVKAAKTTAPGVYRGQLRVTALGKLVHKLPLEVEVLDVTLPAPDIAFWVYHHEYYIPDEFCTPALLQAYYRDMVEHGMNTVSVYNNADVDGSENIDFAHNTSVQKDDPRYAYGLDTIVPWILESGLCSAGQPLFYMPSRGDVGDKPGYGWGGVPKDALKATLDGWQKRKWPELVLNCGDEPGSNTGLVPRLKMVKSWFPSIRLTTAGIDPDVLGQYYDVWIQGEAAIDRDVVKKAEKLGAELWTYNCTAPNTNMPFARAYFGFWAYRTSVKGVAEWAYYDLPRWTADENGDAHGDPYNRHSRVCVSPNGPVPTISWEATREGIDDYRHAQMLRDLCKTAEKRLEEISNEAEELLSKEDRKTIDQREDQRFSRHDPNAPAITWQDSDPEKARGEQLYLASKELAKEIEHAKAALGFVIQPIPFDAMVTRTGLNYHMPKWSRWCPPMGPGGAGENPVTISEDKRKVLASYIIAMQSALQDCK